MRTIPTLTSCQTSWKRNLKKWRWVCLQWNINHSSDLEQIFFFQMLEFSATSTSFQSFPLHQWSYSNFENLYQQVKQINICFLPKAFSYIFEIFSRFDYWSMVFFISKVYECLGANTQHCDCNFTPTRTSYVIWRPLSEFEYLLKSLIELPKYWSKLFHAQFDKYTIRFIPYPDKYCSHP